MAVASAADMRAVEPYLVVQLEVLLVLASEPSLALVAYLVVPLLAEWEVPLVASWASDTMVALPEALLEGETASPSHPKVAAAQAAAMEEVRPAMEAEVLQEDALAEAANAPSVGNRPAAATTAVASLVKTRFHLFPCPMDPYLHSRPPAKPLLRKVSLHFSLRISSSLFLETNR